MVTEVKEKKDSDPILLKLKGANHQQKVEVLFQRGEGGLHYHDCLCVPNMGKLRKQILTKAYNSRYSIHPGATKMYSDLWKVFWWNDMKRHIIIFMAKCTKYQHIKVKNHKPGCMSQEINTTTCKLEVIKWTLLRVYLVLTENMTPFG